MLRQQNLLTAGLMVLLTVSGQSYAVAGGHHGSMGGGGGSGFHATQFSNNSGPRPTFSVQSNLSHKVNNVMPLQVNHAKTLPVKTVLQTQGAHNFQFPKNTNLGLNKGTLGSVTNPAIHKLPILPVGNSGHSGIKFPGNINLGNIKPIINQPIKPVMPVKPICPPYGSGPGKYGNCWGTGCGYGYGYGCGWGYGGLGYCGSGYGNWSCGNWGYGSYGCGYWPGYFGSGYTTCVQPYPVTVSTPVYVTSTPAVAPTATNLVLNDTAVPPAPAAMREIDLAVKGVQIVESATADRGALYRVTVMNKGPANIDAPVRVAALGMKDSQPTDDSPRAMESIKGLKVGESADVNLRMPVMANALPKLLVAVEVPDNFQDRNEMDNVAAGEVAQLTQLASLSK